MPLETTLADITARLRQGRFPNEQAISQGIVLRVLQELGWDTYDTTSVWPEYQTGEGRADFALCHPATKPTVFIEVKPPGRAEEGVRQALDYAFHSGGVQFVLLTDGKTWSFYLTMEQGSYEDRRVYKLDLFERAPAECAEILRRYLTRTDVESGKALAAARTEYRSRNRRSQARAALPDAWAELVAKGNETLLQLISDTVESKSGIRPDDEDVIDYLSFLRPTTVGTMTPARPVARAAAPALDPLPTPPPEPATTPRAGILLLYGKSYPYTNAKEAMVQVLTILAESDSTFLQRCSQHPDTQGRKRRYIARTEEELYPDRPDLREFRASLPGGWLVATNLNNRLKKTIIQVAAEVAGLRLGSDIKVDF